MNESLRIEPPVQLSGQLVATENVSLMDGRYKISKGDPIAVLIYMVHHHEDVWIEHDKFIPERFDPESKYYLTPGGKKRSPLAFNPFTGGRRVCVGKTFAETISKFIVPVIIGRFKFEI